MHTGSGDDREREWPALLAIVAVFAAGWLLVSPRANVPVIDDWVYAWSVEHFLKTGRLEVLDISAFYPIAQILWGALFALVAGFSFTTLRASTVIVAVVGCCAVYLTLRELGCRPVPYVQGGRLFVTDNGNNILDCQIGPITDPRKLDSDIRDIPGVVGTGLFLGVATRVLVGAPDTFALLEERLPPA